MFKCRICNDFKNANDMYGNICYECAEKLYTNRLGLQYLDKHRESYLDFYGIEKIDELLKTKLIDILEIDFQNKLDMDNDSNGQLSKLKEYILEDMYKWSKFVIMEVFKC